MTEDEMRTAVQELAAMARSKGLERVGALIEVGDDDRVVALMRYYAPDYSLEAGGGSTAAEAIADLRTKIEAMPGERERNTRAAVEALEAARTACLKIDADAVAASLTAAVAALSEDLIGYREAGQ